VARHTGFHCGYAGKRNLLYREMTVATVDTKSGDMMLMTETNDLLLRNADIIHPRRAGDDQEAR
jgi:hypothetical protein